MTSLLLWLSILTGFHPQAGPPPAYSQSYSIFIHGSLVGAETVTERTDKDGNRVCSSQDEMLVTDGLELKRMVFETNTVFVKDSTVPMSYSYKYLSGSNDYCEVTVKSGRIIRVLSRAGNISETSSALQPGTVIMDVNVFYPYDVVVRLYDFKKRGRQVFSNFIPIIGSDVPLAVTWLEDSRLDYGKGSIPVRNFRVESAGTRVGNFSTDMSGRLVRVIMREQDLEVVRKDLVPER
jgi:hypothetical protein